MFDAHLESGMIEKEYLRYIRTKANQETKKLLEGRLK